MAYKNGYIQYNKLVRDKIPEYLEGKWIKVQYRILETTAEIIACLNAKRDEEEKELEVAVQRWNSQDIIEECADLLEVAGKNRKVAFTMTVHSNTDSLIYDLMMMRKKYVESRIKTDIYDTLLTLGEKTLTREWLLPMIQEKQAQKAQEKWWFDKNIFLISTDW